jgi:hypothetical protein
MYIGFAVLAALTPLAGGQDFQSQLIVIFLSGYFVLNYHGPGKGANTWATPGEVVMGWAIRFKQKIRHNPYNRSRLPVYALSLATLLSGVFLFSGLGAGVTYNGWAMAYVLAGTLCLLVGVWAFFTHWRWLSFAIIIGLYCTLAILPAAENSGFGVWAIKVVLFLEMLAWVVAYILYSRFAKPRTDLIGFVVQREVEIETTYREKFIPVEAPTPQNEQDPQTGS